MNPPGAAPAAATGRHPAAWVGAALVAALTLAAPLVLWVDPLGGYAPRTEGASGVVDRLAMLAEPFSRARLQLDDFEYVAGSRTRADLARHLLTPHNTHLVPAFRLWTYVWVRRAGTLARLPVWLGAASYLTYAAAMLVVGHLVAWESGRPERGLMAMAAFGVSAVLTQTVAWYAAGQALGAGVVVLASLAALQRWRARGGGGWVVAAALLAAAAPLVWSGGYVAGPAGFAYLWADGRPRARRLALALPAASALTAALALAVAGPRITSAGNFHDRTVAQAFRPGQGAVSTVQAVVEVLVFRNLGVAVETTPLQAGALGLGLAWAWARSRGRPWRPNPLEAAGAVVALLGFALVYTARGYYTFDNLRALTWYQAIPQTGAVLFAAGWWQGPEPGPPPRTLRPPTRAGLLAALGLIPVLFLLQTPRVREQTLGRVPPVVDAERARWRVDWLRLLRSRYLETETAAWQRRFLARLDRAEAAARRAGLGRDDVRRGLGRVVGPGMPADVPRIDGANLMDLPEAGHPGGPDRARALLAPILTPEPEPRPPWLPRRVPWPPPPR